MDHLMEMYTANLQQIDNFLNANREIQQMVGNINETPSVPSARSSRRHYVLGELSIETLQTMYSQNAAHIERLMTLNREIQRVITNNLTPASSNNAIPATTNQPSNVFTYEFTIPITEPLTNLLTSSQVTQATPNSLLPSGVQSLGRSLLQSFMEPIPVSPTPEQIEAATRRVKYGDISRPTNTTCPISLEPFADEDDVVIIRHCGHIFKPTEFETWFNSNCRCPTCRYDIRGTN
jgi:hypothetical protein